MSSIKKNYIFNLIYEIIVVLYPLIVTPYLSRVLLPSGIGIKSYTYSIMTYFYYIGMLGIDIYAQKLISKHKDDIEQRSKSFCEIMLIKAISMSFAIALFYILMVFINLGGEYKTIFAIWGIFLLEALINIKWYYQGIEKFKELSLINVAFKILSIFAIFFFVKTQSDLWIYILILCFTPLLSTIAMWIIVPRTLVIVKVSELHICKHFRNTIIFFVPTIASALYSTIDKAMLKIECGEDEVGFYEQAYKMIILCTTVVSALYPIIRTKCVYLIENKKENYKEDYLPILDEYSGLVLMLSIPLSAGICAISRDFVPLFFGEDYYNSIPILQIMSSIILFSSISQFLYASVALPFSLQRKINVLYFIAASINVLLNLVLIRFLKGVGAAIASSISELFLMISYFVISRKHVSIKGFMKKAIKYVCATILMVGVILIESFCITNLYVWLLVLIEILSGILVYFAFLLVLRDSLLLKYISFLKTKIKPKNS